MVIIDKSATPEVVKKLEIRGAVKPGLVGRATVKGRGGVSILRIHNILDCLAPERER